MMINYKIALALTALTVSGAVVAQGLPPELLGKLPSGAPSKPAPDAKAKNAQDDGGWIDPTSGTEADTSKAKLVHETKTGLWLLFDKNSNTRSQCAVLFRQDGKVLGFVGPANKASGSIAFSGPSVPAVKENRETKITLSANSKPITVRAFHVAAENRTGRLIVPTDIEKTVAGIADAEMIEVMLDGKLVFKVETEAAFKARAALLQCLKQ